MEVSAFSIKGTTLGVQKQRVLPSFGEFRCWSLRPRTVCMTSRSNCCGLTVGSGTMETELTGTRMDVRGSFGSLAKPRFIRVQASDGDIEDVVFTNPQDKSSGTVLPYVGVACLGAILFGYHLGFPLNSILYWENSDDGWIGVLW